MNSYKQLNREQRYQISGLLKAGLKQTQIAAELGVNKATISRVLERPNLQRALKQVRQNKGAPGSSGKVEHRLSPTLPQVQFGVTVRGQVQFG